MPKGHSDLPARIEALEAQVKDLQAIIAHFQEYFAQGYFPPLYVRPNR